MLRLPPFATFLTFGTFLIVVALVIYRLLWAASSLAGSATMVPKRLHGWRRWLHGETAYKKPN
jgi:hypothetical protein